MNWLNEVLNNDPNPVETQEWIESLKAVIDVEGSERAHQPVSYTHLTLPTICSV